ncbi:MAG: uroporphyrinogen-III C-methyltransferase [Acidobacteriota bacterium]|nr:uroporphyrinogen-III C-methyltransferase [Acidobacteriota bacterium]MDP2389255.1 uroporphyrinogen-III C-methyltransferase [Acidobacteriota bacterium]
MRSIVYLIGAGPGAPDLITLRGFHCLQQASVVIYDHRVHADVLQYAPAQAERIDVGGAAPDASAQDAICYLIAEKAREGKVVARLKRGDSFLFDHGGEEALFLHEQGIPFEVVPGVPSAIGASAYAGIPITYPGGGDTVTFVRGFDDDGRERTRLDWDHLAGLGGTMVCNAGPKQLPKMIEALVAHGRPADESAAIIVNGTLPSQRTITGTLAELAKAVEENPVGAAILIVGRVVNFREHLRWFDSRPLFGRRALVMHSKEQPDDVAALLEQQGAAVLLDTDAGIDVYRQLLDRKVDVVTFTSASAVLGFMASVGADQASDLLAHTVVATLGPAAADAVTRANVTPAIQLPGGSLAAFADAISAHFSARA